MMPPRRPARSPTRGFTLIEMIMVIVITGIVAGMVAVFIKTSIDSYLAAERRAELTEAADVGLRRMAREARLALPNSLRVASAACPAPAVGNCAFIEFIPTGDGGRYRDAGDGSTGGNALDFVAATNVKFDVLGPPAAASANDYVVVYNLGPGYAPADAYRLNNCGSAPGCNIAQIAGVSGNTITLAGNPFAAQSPPLPSPGSRFQVVPFATRAVSYVCPTATAGPMMRYWGYGLNANQATPPAGGSRATVVGNAVCAIDFQPAVLQRNGMLFVQLTVADASGESIAVFQQVHMDNTP